MKRPRGGCRARGPEAGLRVFVLAVAAALTGGCEGLPSTSTRPAPSPERRAAMWDIDHDAYAALGYRLDWRGFPAVSGGKDPVRLVKAEDDMVLVLDRSSVLSALAPGDGSTLWRIELANALTQFKGIGTADGRVVAVSASDVYLVDPTTGSLVDRQLLDRVANTKPVIDNDAVVYGTSRGELRLHSVRSRIEIWGNALWGQRLPGPVDASPIVVAGVIGAVTQAGEVFFIDPSTGSMVATNSISGGMASNPVAEGGVMFVASLDQSVYAFSSTSGAQLWRYRTSTPLRTQPSVHDGVLYVAVPGEGMVALDASSGAVRWKAPGVGGTVMFSSEGAVVSWDGRTAVRLDPDTGDVLGRIGLEDVAMIVPAGFESPTLYVVSDRGVVGRFEPR